VSELLLFQVPNFNCIASSSCSNSADSNMHIRDAVCYSKPSVN